MVDSLWWSREQSRRIGKRSEVDNTVASLHIAAGRRRNKTKVVPVQISNASVSGLGFFADHGVLLRIGQLVTFEVDHEVSVVRVRRSADIDHGRMTYYGVEFTESHPAVLPFILDRLTNQRADRAQHESR